MKFKRIVKLCYALVAFLIFYVRGIDSKPIIASRQSIGSYNSKRNNNVIRPTKSSNGRVAKKDKLPSFVHNIAASKLSKEVDDNSDEDVIRKKTKTQSKSSSQAKSSKKTKSSSSKSDLDISDSVAPSKKTKSSSKSDTSTSSKRKSKSKGSSTDTDLEEDQVEDVKEESPESGGSFNILKWFSSPVVQIVLYSVIGAIVAAIVLFFILFYISNYITERNNRLQYRQSLKPAYTSTGPKEDALQAAIDL